MKLRLRFFTSVTDYELIKTDNECRSSDTFLGLVITAFFRGSFVCPRPVEEDPDSHCNPRICAFWCHLKKGCRFFIVGNDGGTEKCYWEHTTSSLCPEGWDSDTYDFYELKG